MIIVLNYDRLMERVLEEITFDDDAIADAERKRVQFEAFFAGNDNVEVVLLRSESRETLYRTHSRYFRSTREIARRLGEEVA